MPLEYQQSYNYFMTLSKITNDSSYSNAGWQDEQEYFVIFSICSREASTAGFVLKKHRREEWKQEEETMFAIVDACLILCIYNICRLVTCLCVFVCVCVLASRERIAAWSLRQSGTPVVLTAHRVTLWQGSWEPEWQGSLRIRGTWQNVKSRKNSIVHGCHRWDIVEEKTGHLFWQLLQSLPVEHPRVFSSGFNVWEVFPLFLRHVTVHIQYYQIQCFI